jgi:hypothetical protein
MKHDFERVSCTILEAISACETVLDRSLRVERDITEDADLLRSAVNSLQDAIPHFSRKVAPRVTID